MLPPIKVPPGLCADEAAWVACLPIGKVRVGEENIRIDVVPNHVLVVPGGHIRPGVEVHCLWGERVGGWVGGWLRR